MIHRRWSSWSVVALLLSAGNGWAADTQTRPEEERVRRERAAQYLKQALAAKARAVADAKDPFTDDLWQNIAVVQAALGQTKEALESVQRVKGQFIAEALIGVARMQIQAGDRNGAKTTIDKANDELKKIKDKTERAVRSFLVVRVQLAMGDIVGTKSTAELIELPALRVRMLLTVAGSQWKAGDKTGTRETYAACAKMIREEPELKGWKGNVEDWEQADADYIDWARKEIATATGKDKTSLLRSMGAAELQKGDKAAAKADCDEARRGVPNLNSGATSKEKLETADFLDDLREVYVGVGEEKVVEELGSEAQKLLVEARVLVGKEGGVGEADNLMEVANAQRKWLDVKGAKETCDAVVTLLEHSRDEDMGHAEGLWEAAGAVAPVDPALARDLVAKAMAAPPPPIEQKLGFQIVWPETGASAVARGIVRAEGAKADLAWIEKIKTERAKAHAYAAAAATMVEEDGKTGE